MIVYSRVDSSKWYGEISDINTDQKDDSNQNSYNYFGDSGADSSSYKFYVELESSEGLILGQHVYMEENLGQDEEKTGLWLEDYYIVQEEDGAYVWAAGADNTMKKQAVTLGEYDEDLMKYEILDGLTVEDYIAFPMDDITEGAAVVYNDISTGDDGMDDMDGMGYDGMDDMDGMDYDGMDGMDYDGMDGMGYDGMDGMGYDGMDGMGYDGMDDGDYLDADDMDLSDEEFPDGEDEMMIDDSDEYEYAAP